MTSEKTDTFHLLGHSETELPASPDEASLEAFSNPEKERSYTITLNYPEFSSLCPVTGQPDAARIEIQYIPAEKCVETKSLKFYLASYRNFAAFNEVIVNRILNDLIKACSPKKMKVRGKFASRGGIQLTVKACHPG